MTNVISKFALLDQLTPVQGTDSGDKRERLLDILRAEIARGSGVVLLTGDAELARRIAVLVRESDRREDMRSLALSPTPLPQQTTSFNPFTTANADEIRYLLECEIGERADADAWGVFQGRAAALAGAIAPALAWLRDNKGIPIDIELVQFAMELRWMSTLARERIVLLRDAHSGTVRNLDVANEIPDVVVQQLRWYLDDLPGYDPARSHNEQNDSTAGAQHGYARFYFTEALSQLAVNLGQTSRVDSGEIDMGDIVRNRRILVVNLSAPGQPHTTSLALGILVAASLRNAAAQLCTTGSDGSSGEPLDKASSRLLVVLNDVAGRVVQGVDRIAIVGRSLNFDFVLTAPDIEGIWMSPLAKAA